MGDELISLALQVSPLLLLAAIVATLDRSHFRGRWFLIALLLIFVHDILLTRFLWQLPRTFLDQQWNWSGKLLALAGILAIAALPAFGYRRSGITLRQAPGSWPAWALTGVLCLFFLVLALTTSDGRPDDADTIAYQWTMPGLEEESFYRGILLLALNEAFTARRRIFGAEMGWGALFTAVLFGAVHGVSFEDGQAGFAAPHFLSTFVAGLLLVWVRERTGSIVAPIVGHNVGNGVSTLF